MDEVTVVAVAKVKPEHSQGDLDAHFDQAHMAPMQEVFGYLAEPPTILFCEPVPAGDDAKGRL